MFKKLWRKWRQQDKIDGQRKEIDRQYDEISHYKQEMFRIMGMERRYLGLPLKGETTLEEVNTAHELFWKKILEASPDVNYEIMKNGEAAKESQDGKARIQREVQ